MARAHPWRWYHCITLPRTNLQYGFVHNHKYVEGKIPSFIAKMSHKETSRQLGIRPCQGWYARYAEDIPDPFKCFGPQGLLHTVLTHKAQSHTQALHCNTTYAKLWFTTMNPGTTAEDYKPNNPQTIQCPLCGSDEPGNQIHMHCHCQYPPPAGTEKHKQ